MVFSEMVEFLNVSGYERAKHTETTDTCQDWNTLFKHSEAWVLSTTHRCEKLIFSIKLLTQIQSSKFNGKARISFIILSDNIPIHFFIWI